MASWLEGSETPPPSAPLAPEYSCMMSPPRPTPTTPPPLLLSRQDLDDIEDENEQLKQENKTLLKVVGQLTR